MEKLIVFGAGQQGRNCLAIARKTGVNVVGFVDDFEKDIVDGVKVYRNLEDIENYRECKVILAVGDIEVRKKFMEVVKKNNMKGMNLIDPSACVEKGAVIGDGNYICKFTAIYGTATIGNHNIINSGAILATDCVIGDNCNICFHANICGDVHVGDNSIVGYCSTISSGYNIGENVHVEANSVVYRDVKDGEYVRGVVR